MLLWPPRKRTWALLSVGLVVTCTVWFLSQTITGRALVRTYAPALSPAAPQAQRVAAVPLPESVFDCQPVPLPWLEPGTVVDDGPPQGWTHLVTKNDTQVVAGPTGPEVQAWHQLATRFPLAVLVEVDRDPRTQAAWLRRLGMGWCATIDGHDRVISARTHAQQRAGLSALEAFSLGLREVDNETHVRIVARSASTLIYDLERVLAYGTEHLVGRIRHGLLVHPQTGEFAALLWIVPPAEIPSPAQAFAERLPPNGLVTFELQFRQPARSGLLLPSPDDYAVVRLPRCAERFEIAPSYAQLAYTDQIDPEGARRIEHWLRGMLGWLTRTKQPAGGLSTAAAPRRDR